MPPESAGASSPPPGYAAPPYAAPAPPPRRRGLLVAVIAVVVIVVIIVAAAFALGVFKGSSGSGTSSGGATPDFGSAQSAAANTANGQSGGPWKLYAGFGIAASYSETSNINTTFLGSVTSSCSSVKLDVANNTAITVSAFGGSLSSGQASAWMFLYASSSSMLVVMDNGGNTFAVASLTCSSLSQFYSYLGTIPSSASSANAAATAWAHGGSAFASAHSGASAEYSVSAPLSALGYSTPSTWGISYDACTAAEASSGASAASTDISVNVTNNAFISQSNATTSCGLTASGAGSPGTGSPSTSLSSDLAFSTATLSQPAGAYTETFTVTTANGGLAWGDISFIDVNASLTNLLSTGYVNVTSGATVLASYDLGNDQWTLGTGQSIAVGQTVAVDFGSQNPQGGGWACSFFDTSLTGHVTVPFS